MNQDVSTQNQQNEPRASNDDTELTPADLKTLKAFARGVHASESVAEMIGRLAKYSVPIAMLIWYLYGLWSAMHGRQAPSMLPAGPH
jgi:hypothetical protein